MQVVYYDPLNPATVNVTLEILRVLSWEQRPIYDETGLDYLYDHFRFSLQFIVSDAATAVDPAIVTDIPANTGYARNLAYIGKVLRTPRLVLQILENNNLLFQSHGTIQLGPARVSAVCDVGGGPKPISFRATEFRGLKSFLATWEVEAWVCRNYNVPPDGGRQLEAINDQLPNGVPIAPPAFSSPVLSHRWSMSDSIGADLFTTRTITGKIVFAADYIRALSEQPDDFRAAGIFHLVPTFFARTAVYVQMASDGNSCTYTVTDTEQPANLGALAPFVKLDSDVRIDEGPGKNWMFLEQTTFTLYIKLYGRPSTPRMTLFNTVISVLNTYGFNPRGKILGVQVFNPCISISSGYDLSGRSAWARATFLSGHDVINDLAGVVVAGSINYVNNGTMNGGEFLGNPLGNPPSPAIVSANNTTFRTGPSPSASGAYETQIEQMVAQALNNEGIAYRLPTKQPGAQVVPNPPLNSFLPVRPDNL